MRKKTRMTFTFFLNSIVFTLVIVPITTISIFTMTKTYRDISVNNYDNYSYFIDLISEQLSSNLSMNEKYMDSLGLMLDNNITDNHYINYYLNDLLNVYDWIEKILILDINGKVLSTSSEKDFENGFDFSHSDFFYKVKEKASFYWSDLFLSVSTGELSVTLSKKYNSKFVVAFLNINILLDSIIKSIPGNDELEMEIRDKNGNLISTSNEKLSNSLYVFQKSGKAFYSDEEKSYSSMGYIFFKSEIRINDWSIFLLIDEAKYNSPIKEYFRFIILSISITLSVFLLIIYLFIKKIKKTFSLLSIDILNIKSGEYSLKSESGHYFFEFDILKNYIKSMANEISSREEELKVINLKMKLQNDYLKRANEELDSFSYSVSHDLRAPLRSISGFSQIIMEDYENLLGEEGRIMLHKINESANKMGELIGDLLKLSRITRKEISLENINITDMVWNIYNTIESEYKTNKTVFKVENNLKTKGDFHLLAIAFDNLIFNALKFSSKKETQIIKIGKTIMDGNGVFFVEDNGIGFDMEYAKNIFKPFQRLHSESEYPGTGIGLSIVSRIIEKHGGRIWVESFLNKGTTFFFTIWDGENENHELQS